MEISFGAIESPPDYRDIYLASVLGEPVGLPKEYFVDVKNLPIWHQRSIGSCTAHAGAKYRQKQEEIETKKVINLSPRWLYTLAKSQDNIPTEGTYPRLIMKLAKEYGCATEETVPNNCSLSYDEYIYGRQKENLPVRAFDEAKQYKIKSYATVGISCEELKQAIVEANGCMVLVKLGREWWTDKNGKNSRKPEDILPLRPPKAITGGHEVYFYGYRETIRGTEFYLINSWGEQWGQEGKGYLIYEDYKPFIKEAITAIDLPNEKLEEVHNLPKPAEFKHNFLQDLELNQRGEEIRMLQIALKIDGCFPKKHVITGFYGVVTQKAVKEFQRKYRIASWWELNFVNGKRVGAKTRMKLNLLFN